MALIGTLGISAIRILGKLRRSPPPPYFEPSRTHLVQLRPVIRIAKQPSVRSSRTSAESSGGSRRPVFGLSSFADTPDGVSYTVCPTSASIAEAQTLAHAYDKFPRMNESRNVDLRGETRPLSAPSPILPIRKSFGEQKTNIYHIGPWEAWSTRTSGMAH